MGQSQSNENNFYQTNEMNIVQTPHKMKKIKISIFSWNTESVEFCHETGCVKADFVDTMLEKYNNPDIIAIGLQESATDSKLLIKNGIIESVFEDSGYKLISITEELGFGLTSATKGTKRGLRLGIFAHERISDHVELLDSDVKFCSSTKFQESIPVIGSMIPNVIKGKGGQCTHIRIGEEVITFINCHLPFSTESFESLSTRKEGMLFQAMCFSNIINELTRAHPGATCFVMGDLNFRISPFYSNGGALALPYQNPRIKEILERVISSSDSINPYDEFRDQDEWAIVKYYFGAKNNNLKIFEELQEGVDDLGPGFFPTCKMCKRRVVGCPHVGTNGVCDKCDDGLKCQKCFAFSQGGKRRYLGWCDRILYKNGKYTRVVCTKYDRYDYGNMTFSDHAAVYGNFEIKKN